MQILGRVGSALRPRALAFAAALLLAACACPYRMYAEPVIYPWRIEPYAPWAVDARTARGALAPEPAARLAVIGDVQRTSPLECCLGREVNDEEQRVLLADLAAQKPAGVVLLGDMAFEASIADWEHFDRLMAPLRADDAGHPLPTHFFPVLGNHDYSGYRWRVETEVGERFPGLLQSTHYSFEWGKVLMVVLDGNREQLCTVQPRNPRCQPEWQAQLDWLRGQLLRADTDAELKGAIVFVHQSPYTRSPWVQKDQADARDFARALLASERGLALISAHAHGYERYAFNGEKADARGAKRFIVTAGGGGPRPSNPEPSEWPEDTHMPLPWPRPFNYLILEQNQSGVRVRVHALQKGERQVRELEAESAWLSF